MNYITTKEVSEKWGITTRRVTKLCKEGRIDGALMMGNIWVIPKDSPRPEQFVRGRKKQKNEQEL